MLGDKWTSLNEEEHFGAMEHCLEFESGTIGTTRAWTGGALREREDCFKSKWSICHSLLRIMSKAMTIFKFPNQRGHKMCLWCYRHRDAEQLEEMSRKQSMRTRVAEDGPEVRSKESSSRETSMRVSSPEGHWTKEKIASNTNGVFVNHY